MEAKMNIEDRFWEHRNGDGTVTSRCWRIVLDFTSPIKPEELNKVLDANPDATPPSTSGFERICIYELREGGLQLICETIDKKIA
jgi:hypothetical protein